MMLNRLMSLKINGLLVSEVLGTAKHFSQA